MSEVPSISADLLETINTIEAEHLLRTSNRYIYSDLYDSGLTFATMESCTGGSVASAFTDIEGSTKWFKGGIVSYTTESKIKFGVPEETIRKYTVYSESTAEAMAKVAAETLDADIGIGVTGRFPVSRACVQRNNAEDTADLVWISIYDRRSGTYFNNVISVGDQEDRIAQKNVVCSEICQMLWWDIFDKAPF